MNTLKYAVLVLPSRSANDTREVQVGSNVETLVAGLADLVDRTELEHWERWVGEGRWGDLSSRTRVVVATAPTSRPEVFDPENEELKASLNPFVTALDLVGGLRRPWGTSFLFSGSARERRVFSDARSLTQFAPRLRPFYKRRSEYTRSFDWTQNPWLDAWLAAAALVRQGPLQPLVTYALNSMSHAMVESELEFRIPELVRAAEVVLALPMGEGASEYAKRGIVVAPHLPKEKFLAGVNVPKLLRELFQLRNACVHGKLPFEELAAQGDAGELQVARLEFAAEEVARAALLLALQAPGSHFATRAALEEAWTRGSFPNRAIGGVESMNRPSPQTSSDSHCCICRRALRKIGTLVRNRDWPQRGQTR